MAEVTYYFDNVGSPVWDQHTKMVDNNLLTFGFTNDSHEIQTIITNTCPGTDLGTITKVELRAYGYGDG